jgi:hypothetical protein
VIHIPNPKYQDWVKEKRPESLQIIDHSLYIEKIIGPAVEAGLYLAHLSSHSIFNRPADYQVLILQKRGLKWNLSHKSRLALIWDNILIRLPFLRHPLNCVSDFSHD